MTDPVSAYIATFTEWTTWTGFEVRATLSRDPLVVQEGTLVKLSGDGEAVIRDDSGIMHWCWPALEMERLPRNGKAPTK